MKIIIAEDDPISERLLTKALSELGHEVSAFGNGRAALDHFRSNPTRIVISDWMMPEMDGITLCEKIRALQLEDYTYFLMLTAKADPESYRLAMQQGVDDFLSKPLNKGDLIIRLRVAERIVRQRQEAEEKIRLLARFPADNPNPVLQVNKDGRILYANTACIPLIAEWQSALHQPAPPALRHLVDLLFRTGARQEIEIDFRDRTFSFAATSRLLQDSTYVYGHDITPRKLAELELVRLKNEAVERSLRDQLTGLPNRLKLDSEIPGYLSRAKASNHKLAVVVVDLDNFKLINDGYGHKVGDQVLVAAGQAIQANLRHSDLVCRWGGDELVLILDGLQDKSVVPGICEKLSKAVKAKVASSEIPVRVTLSMGSAVFPEDADQFPQLLQFADYALYLAKSDGRDCWRAFNGFPDSEKAKACPNLFLRLTQAVQADGIQVYYQPIMALSTNQTIGVEALARWNDSDYGWISPDIFIPLAEEKGLISRLGAEVASRSIADLEWLHQQSHPISLSLNVSKRQLLDPGFLDFLNQTLVIHHCPPRFLVLEVTERQSVLTHPLGRERLHELHTLGFKLSLDDFGSGYSSFDQIADLPFAEVKIAKGLVDKWETPKGRRVLRGIIEMAKALELEVLAEGIESIEQQQCLLELGATTAQGYLFGKPMPAQALARFLMAHPPRSSQPASTAAPRSF